MLSGVAATELRCEIVDCRGLDVDAREPPDHAATKLAQARGQERAIEEALRIFAIGVTEQLAIP